jgi:SSS family solute:Na+ symporter
LGKLPLFAIYLGGKVGPAVIAATTISGTMVMGVARIFLQAFRPGAGPRSSHLPFWPGMLFGNSLTIEGAAGVQLFPGWVDVGVGRYADDLGVNIHGLVICTASFFSRLCISRPGLDDFPCAVGGILNPASKRFGRIFGLV